MNDHQDLLDEISADDAGDRHLASALRIWRESSRAGVEPDGRLEALFSSTGKPPGRWRQWMQRPAIAFAASFAAVLVLGVGAFALVANSGDAPEVAAPTTSALSAPEGTPAALGDITLPEDLSEQTGFATCVFDQLTAWFDAGLEGSNAPRIFDECGMPPIPDLGPEAAAFRDDLQAWANCAATEVQAILPQLPGLLRGDGEVADPLERCGEPPNPRDYGLELPFLDFGEFDPSQFDFGPFNLEEFKLRFEELDPQSFDLQELLRKIPPGLLPEDFDIENLEGIDIAGLKELFGNFEGFDTESCQDATELPGIESLEDFENFDFEKYFSEGCVFGFFGSGDLGLGALFLDHLENFDLEGLDLESLLGELDLESLDLDQLLADLFGDEELDFGAFFDQFADA